MDLILLLAHFHVYICVHAIVTFPLILIVVLGGIELEVRTVDIDGKKIQLQMLHIYGQEIIATVATHYYRNAMVSWGCCGQLL